jgi:DNA polymerase-3 subunit epsilon
MIKLTRPLVILDTETTGLDPAIDRIVEFAALTLNPDGTRKKYWTYFNPGVPIPAEATAIHGIGDTDVAESPRFAEKAQIIHKALSGKDIGGYNIWAFDLPLLDEEFRRCGLKLDLTGVRVLDSCVIHKKKQPRTLAAALLNYCGRRHEGAHSAIKDSEAAADVLEEELNEYPDLAGLSMDQLANYCLPDRKPADLAGKIYLDQDGELRFGFGKHKGDKLKSHLDYCQWMVEKGKFPGSTLDVIRGVLESAEVVA